jgi:hypothetical protein
VASPCELLSERVPVPDSGVEWLITEAPDCVCSMTGVFASVTLFDTVVLTGAPIMLPEASIGARTSDC